MSISADKVWFDDETMWLAHSDGRTLGVPLSWFPRLAEATEAQRAEVEITPFGLHWAALDEDLSVEGLLSGSGEAGAAA